MIGLGLVLALQILGLTAMAASLLATGGIVAIVFGFAFREIGENLLAGIFLAISRSFEVGDLIESNDLRGIVRDIDLRQVHVRTPDGRDIFIPSAQIFKNPLVNFTRDHLRRAQFTIGIDYRDDPERARHILATAVAEHEAVLERPRGLLLGAHRPLRPDRDALRRNGGCAKRLGRGRLHLRLRGLHGRRRCTANGEDALR